MSRTSSLALMTAGALTLLALAGCTAGSDDPTDALDGVGADGGPTIYLNVTANGETHRFSTADLPGGSGGDDEDDGGSDANVTATSSSGTVTASGNATGGNGTAQGNATASNGTATGGAGGDPPGGSGVPGLPSGDAPLNVTVQIGASGLPDEADSPVNWTLDWGDAFSTSGGNTSANATVNGTAARQQAQESGTDFPATLRHSYSTPGRYDLSLVVQVAGQALDTLRTPVVVGEGAEASLPAGTPLGNQTEEFTGNVPVSDPFCQLGGSEEFEWVFNSTFNGTPSAVQRIVVTVDTSGLADVTLTVVDANETEIASGEEIDETGPFAPGTYTLVAEACGSADQDYVITAVQEHVSS